MRFLSGALIWLLAQFGLRTWMHSLVVHATGLQIPLQETGAFNLFAWQALWVVALWLGARTAQGVNPLTRLPGWVFPVSALVCLFFLGVRHEWLGPHLTPQTLGMSRISGKLDRCACSTFLLFHA